MNKIIITTTINPVTEEIRKYDAMEDWHLIVTGDRKTPEYLLERGKFMSWEEQQERYSDLCNLIGPDNTMRGRMIALIAAYEEGADLVALIDDDCMPYEGWPGEIYIDKPLMFLYANHRNLIFDPVQIGFGMPSRGVPPQLTPDYSISGFVHSPMIPLVQAMMWDGQPDIDAVWRLHQKRDYGRCGLNQPIWSSAFSPFDPQNTLISGKVLKDYCGEIPFVGHVSDIWAGYLFQAYHPNSTLYCPATVRHWQDRTYESILSDLEGELYSYRYGLDFLQGLQKHGPDHLDRIPCLPLKAIEAINLYRSYFE